MPYRVGHTTASSLVLAAALTIPRPVDACGTMLFTSHAERPGGMNGQELFLSLTPDATTLVLSASFIDASGDKAFLLPLMSVPDEVRDADDALFVALESGTVPVVSITEAEQWEPSIGCSGASRGGDFGGGNNDVEVLDRGSTATYDYVVVGGDTGTALADWLNTAGFGVPAEFEAALDDYASDGWYFLAATLNSDAPEGHVAPLELRLPASYPATTIPFGIAAYALAPSDALDITLYVASPGTVLPQNYAVATIDEAELAATSATTSNYSELFDALVEGAPTWVVEYSNAQWNPSDLDYWVQGDEEHGIYVDQDVDTAWLTDFHERLGYDQARLTRVRTRLSAADLTDLRLDAAADVDVDRDHYVTWDPKSGGCSVTTSPMSALVGLAMLALLRRRRTPSL
jgi:MYXO-CTERM domain-containing protein